MLYEVITLQKIEECIGLDKIDLVVVSHSYNFV